MDFPYLLSPAMNLVWLIFAMAMALAIVSWRKRRQVGALPLFFAGSASVVWAFALGAEFVSINPDTQSTWYAIRSTMLWPLSFSLTGFVFEYAGLKRFLRRPVVIAMLVVIFAHAILAFTNDWHGLMWRDLTRRHDGLHAGSLGVAAWGLFWANILLMLLDLGVLNRKFIRSPSSRRMLWLIFPAILFARLAYSFDVMQHRWDTLGEPALAAVGIPLFLYLVAIFRMRLFDPVPSAQATAVAQLRDAVLVVSPTPRRIAYANPAAAQLLGRSADDLVDQPIGEVLPPELMDAPVTESATVAAGRASVRHRVLADREVVAESTDLVDSLGTQVGQLIVVRDVTEQNRAFARELDRERAMAALSERDHLAREMHDTVGQVLGYVSMQSQAADKLLRAGETDRARDLLAQLTAVAQNAHDGVRATIATLKGTTDADWHFRGALREYVDHIAHTQGIDVELQVDPDVSLDVLDTQTGVQVLRVVQEATVNALRHGRAGLVKVVIVPRGPEAIGISVIDDGRGFEAPAAGIIDGHYGMTFMRERMAEIGGTIEFRSEAPGATTVDLTIPVRGEGAPR